MDLFSLLLKLLNSFVDFSELKFKVWIKEWSVIISVIVVTVTIHVTSRRCNRSFMTINGITTSKMNDFVGNLKQLKVHKIPLRNYLAIRIFRIPFGDQSHKHSVRSIAAGSTNLANNSQFVVSQTDFFFVRLCNFSILQRTQLSSRHRVNDSKKTSYCFEVYCLRFQTRHVLMFVDVTEKVSQITFANRPNWIQIGGRTVILGDITDQAFVHIRSTQNQK